MLYIIVFLILVIFNTPFAHAGEIQGFAMRHSTGIGWHKILNTKDLIYRNGFGYKKFTNIPFTGRITGKEEGYLSSGKWDGPYKSYYKTGQLEQEGFYRKKQKEGLWKFFRRDGNIMTQGNYKNGRKDGLWKYYHLFGTNLQMLKSFKNGVKDGIFKSFYGNGNLMQKGGYKNGTPNGPWIFYEKNGRKVRNRKIY